MDRVPGKSGSGTRRSADRTPPVAAGPVDGQPPPHAAGRAKRAKSVHHHVYVVYLKNPRGDGRAGYYVGMTGLTPEERFANHKTGHKAASVVRRFGERLVPRLYAHLNPMSYADAKAMEPVLADSLRKRGYQVFGGH